jgi:hypothetical protein
LSLPAKVVVAEQPILICSFYIMALYLLGARGGPPDRVLSRIGGPVAAVIILTFPLF